MELILERFAYNPENTQGKILVDGWSCFTIERPWIKWNYPGGRPFVSCIPEGDYDLVPYMRSNGDRALAMVNEDLGVYFRDADRPINDLGLRRGRYKTLIHGRANYVGDVEGCAAVGKSRLIAKNHKTGNLERMVTSSTLTMTELLSRIGWESGHMITIRQASGAIQ